MQGQGSAFIVRWTTGLTITFCYAEGAGGDEAANLGRTRGITGAIRSWMRQKGRAGDSWRDWPYQEK